MKQQVFDYTLYVSGIFGRNRTKKFKGFPLLKDSPSQISLENLLALMDSTLNQIKLKPGAHIKVVEQPVTIEGEFKTFMCFSDITLLKKEWNGK
jgi:hypothetical protein